MALPGTFRCRRVLGTMQASSPTYVAVVTESAVSRRSPPRRKPGQYRIGPPDCRKSRLFPGGRAFALHRRAGDFARRTSANSKNTKHPLSLQNQRCGGRERPPYSSTVNGCRKGKQAVSRHAAVRYGIAPYNISSISPPKKNTPPSPHKTPPPKKQPPTPAPSLKKHKNPARQPFSLNGRRAGFSCQVLLAILGCI